MTEPDRVLPAGTDVVLSAPSFPPTSALLDRLRTFVRQHARVGAVYVFGLRHGDAGPVDVVGLSIVEGDAADHAAEVDDLRRAVVDVLPAGATVDLTVLGSRGELDVLGAFAPVGAGGVVEVACARALADPGGVARLATRLAAATLYVPALGPDSGAGVEDGPADGGASGASSGVLGRAPDPPAPRPNPPGAPVRWPLTRLGGHDVVSVFSSWPALLHADPPFPDQVTVPGRAILDAIPEGVGLAIDPGCLHAIVLPAADVPLLRTLAG